jgi:hypothetical protein
MRLPQQADERYMAKVKKQSGESQELKPEMRELILRFDAKDRRDEDGKTSKRSSRQQRRRRENPTRAA